MKSTVVRCIYSTGSSCGFKSYKVVTVLDHCPFIAILYFSVHVARRVNACMKDVFVEVQCYPCFEFYFLLFLSHNHTVPYPKTKEHEI